MDNLEIKIALEREKFDNISNEEIVNWIFSEGKEYYLRNKEFKEERGFEVSYTGHDKDGSSNGFSGAIGWWAKDYSPKNRERITEISRLVVERITDNYDSMIRDESLEEITTAIRMIVSYSIPEKGAQKKLFETNQDLKEKGLVKALEKLYEKIPKNKEDIFNDIVISLGNLDTENRERYFSQVIK